MRLAVFLTACLAAAPLNAETLSCADPLFRVEAADSETARRACRSAVKARAILLSCGIELTKPVEIAVVERIDSGTGPCLGLYHCGEDRIDILSPSAMSAARDTEGAFAGIADAPFWDSVLVHEMTHAAYDQTECPFGACVATSEYASYAMQVRSLAPADRAGFGKDIELKGSPDRDAISAVMFFLAPDRFAAYAWQHFNARPDPCGYMQLIMDGKIQFDRERPYAE